MAWRKAGSRALLIPGIWVAVQGSRPISYWIGTGGGDAEADPVNTLFFAVMIGSATLLLLRRGFSSGTFLRRNKALILVYAFLAISAFWSEMPFTSLKRLVKDFACVPVGLIILTEAEPASALRAIFVRVSYLLFPLSAVFIKYFPSIGRQASRAGENMFTGVTTQKNSLGEMVFVLALVIIWDWIELRKCPPSPERKLQIRIRIGMLCLGIWLLVTCDSQTSIICLALGSFVFWISGRLQRIKHGKQLLIAGLSVAICLVALDKTYNFSAAISAALGRNSTLTGRTDIWRTVLEQKTDPVLGEGFYIFWDTEKGKNVVDELARINSTHNGYLETYVDAGLVGNALLALFLLAAGNRIIQRLFSGSPLGRIGLAYWVTALLYNLSESSFFRLDLLWFSLLFVAIEYRRVLPRRVSPHEQLARVSSVRGYQLQTGVTTA